MRLVLDANIFVSAYFWHGNPKNILNRIAQKLDTLFISDAVINEVGYVIKKPKFNCSEEESNFIMTDIKVLGKTVAVSPQHQVKGVCRDPKDDKYLECAIAAGADYIISGDRDLLDLKEYGGVKIVSARDYLDIVGG